MDQPQELSHTRFQRSTNSNATIAYRLFMYRQNLQTCQGLKLSLHKLHLTEEMVSYSVDHIMEYASEELPTINWHITFTEKLKSRMERMRQMQKMVSATQCRMSKKRTTTI